MKTLSQILVVLDLDETLIHATKEALSYEADFSVQDYDVYKRPGLENFLKMIAKQYHVALWSAASDRYVEEIAEIIKPEGFEWEFVWGRSRCSTRRNLDLDEYVHEKRLKKVKKLGFPIERILIVDDSPEKTKENYGNAIYIKPFEGNREDTELNKLISYLDKISDSENMRIIEKRGWDKK